MKMLEKTRNTIKSILEMDPTMTDEQRKATLRRLDCPQDVSEKQAPEVMTYAEAAKYLRVSTKTIRRLVATKDIRSLTMPGRVIPFAVRGEDVRRLAEINQ